MRILFYAIYDVPNYLLELFRGPYKFYAIGAAVLFLVVLFLSGKVVTVLRDLFVLACVTLGVIAYFKRKYPLVWVCVFALIILAMIRLLLYIFVTLRDARRARKIERRALEKAEQRRGLWKEKRGYSGDRPEEDSAAEEAAKPVRFHPENSVPGPAPEASVPRQQAAGPAAGAGNAPLPSDAPADQPSANRTFTRDEAISAAHKLKDLKELGILTNEEFELIKARLYARLG